MKNSERLLKLAERDPARLLSAIINTLDTVAVEKQERHLIARDLQANREVAVLDYLEAHFD